MVEGKSVLDRVGDGTAVADANFGAGRSSVPTNLPRGVKELGIWLQCALVAFHISGRDKLVADALSRYALQVSGQDPRPIPLPG